jgi:starch synthase (maltosyl-transferring)
MSDDVQTTERPSEDRARRRLPGGKEPPRRIQIQDVWPLVACGRYPPKRSKGDAVQVWATVFRDGHEVLRASVKARPLGERRWQEAPLVQIETEPDRWTGAFRVDRCGRWQFAVEAWVDRFASWRWEIQRKVEAGQDDLSSELAEGEQLLAELERKVPGEDGRTVRDARARLGSGSQAERCEAALDEELQNALQRSPVRHETVSSALHELDVDRERARFGSWYELFPRSWGGFRGVARVLPQLADLGFDVVYLPPIHPIGRTNRKGKNNTLAAGPGDPGSPWAIGSDEGGHDAIDPELGTLADFEELVLAAERAGVEIALDFAIQCSPDHPWLREHPEWFHRRPDGTLKYAENPPKRYQDIYNVNFDCEDWQGLWQALYDVVRTWVDRGIRVFRVDNPHTKPIPFWEWLIREIRREEPDVIFLAEAFTKPAMMATLAAIGFNQSYTYFTWKNTKWELTEYMTELTETHLPEVYRPNFFVNTPDILHEYLQHGGPPAFHARLILAGTLSPSYGVYSGFESFESVPVREGSEEYLDSEKYETKARRLDGPLLPVVQRLNRIRRDNPALQRLENLQFLETENSELIGYVKRERDNVVVTIVNLDAWNTREGVLTVPAALNLPPAFDVRDLLTDEVYPWHIGRNYVRLEPGGAHILRVGA